MEWSTKPIIKGMTPRVFHPCPNARRGLFQVLVEVLVVLLIFGGDFSSRGPFPAKWGNQNVICSGNLRFTPGGKSSFIGASRRSSSASRRSSVQVVVPRAQVVVPRAQVVVRKTCGFTRRRSSKTTILVSPQSPLDIFRKVPKMFPTKSRRYFPQHFEWWEEETY